MKITHLTHVNFYYIMMFMHNNVLIVLKTLKSHLYTHYCTFYLNLLNNFIVRSTNSKFIINLI